MIFKLGVKLQKNSLLSLDKKDGLTYATLQKGQTSKVIEKKSRKCNN